MSTHLRLMALLTALAALSYLAGCSSSSSKYQARPDAKIKDRLSTNIADNGLKLFTYTVILDDDSHQNELSAPVRQRRLIIEQGQTREVDIEPDLSEWTEQIEHGLLRTLEMSGYCREGIVELSRMIELNRGEIRGECNEGATEDDRRRFGTRG